MPQSVGAQITAGSLLRSAREREGLHIAALAVSMKVPVKKLEALEADRLDLLPDAVFVRALAASVCRTLKIDAAPVLELLPASAPPRLSGDDRGINTPFDAPGQANNASILSFLGTPPALMVVLLMVAAVVVYFYPVAAKDPTVTDKFQAVAHAVAPEVITEAVEPSPPVSQGLATSSSTVSPVVVASASNLAAATSLVPAPSAMASAPFPPTSAVVSVANVPTSSASSASASQGNFLQFRAKGTAWVQVTDAKGVQLLSRTLQTGEIVGVAGALPLAVVVGRVDLTSVELHGKPYDLGPIAQNNVARFEVKQ